VLQAWPVAASVLATGVFFGIARTETEWWGALPVSLLPYGFAHVAFHRAHETQRTYRQTIRELSRIPEVSALSPDGHGDRTASLSLDIAAQLGVSPKDAQDLEYAAQMHDIGRIALDHPSILRMGFTDEDIARWGAEMVAEVTYLEDVAELVSKQHEPYRRPGEQKDPDLPMGAKIIKAASAYDHATTELGFMPVEALEVLHRGAAYDYDPDVVTAIRTVLEREGVVG
jgi:response regulator RpfG family c-di-GMP phosphodiesterase